MASIETGTATAEERTPAVRRRTPKSELENLSAPERVLYRAFEYTSSLWLALPLLIWLVIELVVGATVESQINASAAKYFVYGNVRFSLLLALLALNIACAALIRFPWKRYQTGFVVTHIGLLTIIAGGAISRVFHVDALLNVGQGEIVDTMIQPDQEVVRIHVEDPRSGKEVQQVRPVEFGPLTWGSTILGFLPWKQGHEEVLPFDELGKGTKLRVRRFVAHCDWKETFVEDKAGMPAVKFTLSAPTVGNFEQTNWASAQLTEIGFIGDEQVRVGGIPVRIRTWKASSQAELDHFTAAAPTGPIAGVLGQVGISHAGKHHVLTVDDLQKQPFEDAGSGLKVEFLSHMPHAQLDRATNEWKNVDDNPEYPVLRLRLTLGGEVREASAFANNPEFVRPLAARSGLPEGTLVTYFRPDHPSEVQFLVTAGGQLGYRAFSGQACVSHSVASIDQPYPSFGMFQLIPREVLASGRPDLEIIPKRVTPGEQTFPAVEVEFSLPSGERTVAHLVRQLPDVRRMVEGKIVSLRYKLLEEELPFAIRLDDFNEPRQPGTMNAAAYESFVTVFAKKEIPKEKFNASDPLQAQRADKTLAYEETRKAEIKMNHPLDFQPEKGHRFTLYQSGIQRSQGVPVSTYTVAYDPGWILVYPGSVILCVGIFLMFYMGGYFRKKPTRPAAVAQPS